jgi:monoamine oxidase
MTLSGVSVIVAGAGLAGLTAAYDLMTRGAAVIVIEARSRVGGRVWTIRDGFTGGQHAEGGADMIDDAQTEIRSLAATLGLRLSRILAAGFGYVRTDPGGRSRLMSSRGLTGWERLADRLEDLTRQYRLAEGRWDSPIAAAMARRSVAEWLDEAGATADLRATAIGLRGFFLADPDELSLIALVDQFAEEQPGWGAMYRIEGGNDRLASALARRLGDRIRFETELSAVSHRGHGVRASVTHAKTMSQLTADYLVLALPASVLRRVPITPALPVEQHEAIASLKYGRVTRTLLQFPRRFWRAAHRPRAFGSSLPIGAVWEGNEEQPGRAGILNLHAGGSASDDTQAIVARDGIGGLVTALGWLGSIKDGPIASTQIVWESDPWARGGYAFFDPAFPPSLRPWLPRAFGRLFFAGEHTSMRWQGYMNGAVESGRRAAAEIEATHRLNL